MQDVVHAPRPDQFCLRVGHEKVATAALIQAGIDEAQRFGALVLLVEIDTPVVKDLTLILKHVCRLHVSLLKQCA